jgi:hypothetical protein
MVSKYFLNFLAVQIILFVFAMCLYGIMMSAQFLPLD